MYFYDLETVPLRLAVQAEVQQLPEKHREVLQWKLDRYERDEPICIAELQRHLGLKSYASAYERSTRANIKFAKICLENKTILTQLEANGVKRQDIENIICIEEARLK